MIIYFKGKEIDTEQKEDPLKYIIQGESNNNHRHWPDAYYLIWDKKNRTIQKFSIKKQIENDNGISYKGAMSLIETNIWMVVTKEIAEAEIDK